MATVPCPKCGAPIALDVSTTLVKCEYCQSQVFLDRRGAAFVYIYPYLLGAEQAQGTFRRWTAGSRMAKDLEAAARVTAFQPLYFPVYFFKRRTGPDVRVHLEPAKATTLPGLHGLKVPPGDMKVYDASFPAGGAEVVKPEIDMLHYLNVLPGEPMEQALVYLPLYRVTYDYGGASYTAVLDGSSGEVFATSYPPRKSGAYVGVAALGLVASIAAWSVALLFPRFLVPGIVGAVAVAGAVTALGYKVAKEY